LYLKGIELTGFKSFADKTQLSFERGVTSVVGPNGSGKSNISDAIRWVMGEMSAKSLRGSNMQDVIFAGTQARKPLGFAQVSITLDNSDKALDIEYGEVTVTRRVYRSGESEYYINGAACRLRDIHELFMDTGLGRDGYSIIGQGKVNEIISGKADDRRYIFDEAAGISKYRHRKDEAERKLLHAEDNLVRIGDIVTELESQLEPLSKQSQKAKKYLDLREEMKKLELNVFMQTVDKIKAEVTQTNESFNIVTDQLLKLQAENEKGDAEVERLNQLADSLEREIEQKRGESADTEVAVKGFLGDIDVLKTNIESNERLSERVVNEIELQNKKIEELSLAAQLLENEKLAKTETLSSIDSQSNELTSQNEELLSKINELSLSINNIKAEVIERLNEVSAKKSQLSSLEAFKKSFIQRIEVIEAEKESMGAELEETLQSLAQSQKAFEESNKRASEGKAQLESLEKQISEIEANLAKLKGDIENKNATLSKHQSQLYMLREMEREYEGFAKSVKGVLSANEQGKLSGAKIYGALSSLIGVDKKYVTAIEALLGGALQNVVVQSEEDAKNAIEYLKQNHMGRVTFLPVSSVNGRELDNKKEVSAQKGYIGLASELVSFNERYDKIIKSLLGRCVVVDTIDNAIAMSKKFSYKFRVATLEGELFNAGGSISGGFMNKSTGILSRAAQIKELEAQSVAEKKELEMLNSQMQKAQEEANAIFAQRKGMDIVVRAAEQESVRLGAQLEHIKQSAEAKKHSGESIESELIQLGEQIADTNEQLASVINTITALELEIDKSNDDAAKKESELLQLNEKKDALAESINEKNIELIAAKKDIAAYDYRLSENAAQKDEALCEIENKKKDIDEIKNKNEQILVKISYLEKQIDEQRGKASTVTELINKLSAEREQVRGRVRECLDESKESRDKIYALKEEQNRIDNKRVKIEAELDSITTKMWEEYEVTYLGAKEYEADIGSLTSAKARVGELRASIRALGNVNVDAIEEYISVRERYDFLSNQQKDLMEAKQSLEKLIESIQEKMKTQFKAQFEIINQKFSETFSELFGGGRAELRLTDPTDILGSGVEIDAQPPGKKLQNLSLLSGGEMAFCAIALLFAILKVRPTPFCVLDEIEAALDESNVYRFADYVKNYSDKTQFILVTHRRGTMEAADLLYGVTMQEKGVSKLLTLKLDEAVKIQE